MKIFLLNIFLTFLLSLHLVNANGVIGSRCTTIRDCQLGLVCVSGNPIGICSSVQGVIGISTLVTNLIQQDYSFPSVASQPTPLLTSRAMAIIHLAAHDAYALLSQEYRTILSDSSLPKTIEIPKGNLKAEAVIAMQAAGLHAAKSLYPKSATQINAVLRIISFKASPGIVEFGQSIANAWITFRGSDPSRSSLTNFKFAAKKPLHHQPDPNFPSVRGRPQLNMGHSWRNVKPFVLSNVQKQAYLGPYPKINSPIYRQHLKEVSVKGQCNKLTTSSGVPLKTIGQFWGYDGAPSIGVPPRLYLQVILAVKELKTLSIGNQIRALTAVSVSMADAGIAAWLWKFKYDLWRPTVGIRQDPVNPNPTWNPTGIALSNFGSTSKPPSCVGVNPNFPAYPSGHASFGSAAFKTLASLLKKDPKSIRVTFTSDEYNGRTVEGTTGKARPVFTQTISLQQAIEQNKDSRVYLGVHWRFDSDGGDIVGTQVAKVVANTFQF